MYLFLIKIPYTELNLKPIQTSATSFQSIYRIFGDDCIKHSELNMEVAYWTFTIPSTVTADEFSQFEFLLVQ